jgi:hypothetical protein
MNGSISEAYAKCGNKNCRCQTNKKYLHGPYYRWTGFIKGKRTTKTLTETQMKECLIRIKNFKLFQNKIDELINESIKNAPWVSTNN